MRWLNLLAILALSTFFGVLLSTYVTPELFKKMNANVITTGFIAVLITLTSLISFVHLAPIL